MNGTLASKMADSRMRIKTMGQVFTAVGLPDKRHQYAILTQERSRLFFQLILLQYFLYFVNNRQWMDGWTDRYTVFSHLIKRSGALIILKLKGGSFIRGGAYFKSFHVRIALKQNT